MRLDIWATVLVAVLAFAPGAQAQLINQSDTSSADYSGSTDVTRNGATVLDVSRTSVTDTSYSVTGDAGANTNAVTIHEADANFDQDSGTVNYTADTDVNAQAGGSASGDASASNVTGADVNGTEVGGETVGTGTGEVGTGDQGVNESFGVNESDSITVIP